MLKLGKIPQQLLSELIHDLPTESPEIIIPPGIGHDAAGLKIGDRYFAVTTDPITFATNRLATYSVSVNVNDIACLGCRPKWYSASLLLPKNFTEDALKNIWHELSEQLNLYNIKAIGGHTEVTEAVNQPIIVGQMIGEAIDDQLINISDAKAGDDILLCQSVSIEGTALIATEKPDQLKQHFTELEILAMQDLLIKPGICIWPLIEKLLPQAGLVGLHDPTEGGLATALHEVADAANAGFIIHYDAISFLPETIKLSGIFKIDPLGLLASGSLLIVCHSDVTPSILEKMSSFPIYKIGELTSDVERILMRSGSKNALPRFDQDEIIKIYHGV